MLLLLAIFYAALLTTGVYGAPSPPAAAPERKNCPAKCGDIDIPYPFGVGTNCSLTPEFNLTCNETTSPPTLLTGEVKVASITLETARMVAYTYLTYSCNVPLDNGTWQRLRQNMAFRVVSPFLLSPSANVFTAVGCRSTARIKGRSVSDYLTGCITTCARVDDTGDDGTPCSGHGCCEASLTPRLNQVSVGWNKRELGSNPVRGSPCQYAFVATKGCRDEVHHLYMLEFPCDLSVWFPAAHLTKICMSLSRTYKIFCGERGFCMALNAMNGVKLIALMNAAVSVS